MKDKETLLYIDKLKRYGQNYGLDRTKRLLELLGNPEKNLKLIHIAGTNGKGSTSAILGKILEEEGFKIGYFNSPHLEDLEESIRINNENISEEELVNLFNEIKPFVDKVIDEGYNHPTEFEVLTCIMFKHLYNENVDFGVIEVGLGGRLDSTNVITPILSLITSISLDHTNILGNTLREIAYEKSGIIKENVPVVSAIQEEEVLLEIEKKAKEKNTSLYLIKNSDFKLIDIINEEKIYQKVNINFENFDLTLKFPLLGEHQLINLTLALKAVYVLKKEGYIKINEDKILNAIKNVAWDGRFEIINNNPKVIIDAAHNLKGIEALKDTIDKYCKYNKLYLLLGILKDKEVDKMVETIAPIADKIYTLTPNSIRAMEGEDLRKIVIKYNKNVENLESYNNTIKEVLSFAKKDDLVIIAGSIYLIGDIRSLFKS